jgi:hypothetical protein
MRTDSTGAHVQVPGLASFVVYIDAPRSDLKQLVWCRKDAQ